MLKLSTQNTPNISSKETLSNSDRSKRDNFNNKKKNENDNVWVSCCFFGRKYLSNILSFIYLDH